VNYLVDTSALVRIVRLQVDPSWRDLAERGLFALCEPVLTETLMTTDAKGYARLEKDLRDTYPWATVRTTSGT